MPSLGPAEILVVLVIALLVFGPDKLPEIGRQVGKGFREFQRVQQHLKSELARRRVRVRRAAVVTAPVTRSRCSRPRRSRPRPPTEPGRRRSRHRRPAEPDGPEPGTACTRWPGRSS